MRSERYTSTGTSLFVRLVILGAILAILSARQTYSQAFLRAVEYSLFGVLTLLWIFSRYESILLGANAGNVAELLLDGRTSMIGLFLLMVVHGIFIPHRWHETARVVMTMALAPALVLVLFEARHPELAQQVSELMSWRYVSTNILIVLVGAVLATYASLRAEQPPQRSPRCEAIRPISAREQSLAAEAWGTYSWPNTS